MMDFHQTHGARATIALTPVADPTQYGVVETGVTGQVKRFLEKPAPEAVTTNMINAGTYVLEPEVLDWVKPATRVSIEREIFPALLGAAVPVFAYATDAYWIDIGTPEKYLQINRDLLRGLATVPRRVARHDRRGLSGGGAGAQELVGPLETDAAPEFEYHGVTLRGQVVVGDGSRVAAGSTVEDSVIWHHVNIGPGAWVSQSIIADGCALGEGCHVSGAVLGKNVTVAAGVHITPGARVNAGEVVTA